MSSESGPGAGIGNAGGGAVLLALLLVLGVVPGSALAAWWWPTQGEWTEQQQMTHRASWLGSATAVNGDTLVTSTQLTQSGDHARTDSGTGGDWAYVFERGPMGTWEQTAKLVPSDAREGDTFAYSLALDEDAGVLVAGNPAAERIYVFERASDGQWVETAILEPPADADGIEGLFGLDVAVSGDTAIAAWYPHSYTYTRDEGGWSMDETLPGGYSLAMEGHTLVASRFQISTGSNEVSIYTNEDDRWEEITRIDPGRGDRLACDVDIDREQRTVVLGSCIDNRVYGLHPESAAPLPDGYELPADAGVVGSALVYELADGEWEQAADLPNPDPTPGNGDLFGYSVAADGDRVVVGAPWENDNGAKDGAGGAYIYTKTGQGWLLESKLRNHDNGPYGGGDLFGYSVDISRHTVAAGAPTDDQRRDGTPYPVNDDGDVPPCVRVGETTVVDGCDNGEEAGSVYLFEPVTEAAPVAIGGPGER